MKSKKLWSVYLIKNSNNRTYIGSTVDVKRRLRQHNGEIKGGARSTRNHGPWQIHCYISGFKDRSSACRWEKIIKSRSRGLAQREYNFLAVFNGKCPEYKNRPIYEVPSGLKLMAYININEVSCD